jgi:hypothetical protein
VLSAPAIVAAQTGMAVVNGNSQEPRSANVNLPSSTGGTSTVSGRYGDTSARVRVGGDGDVSGRIRIDGDRGTYGYAVSEGLEGAINQAARGGDATRGLGDGVSRGIRGLDTQTVAGDISKNVASKVVRDLARGNTGDLGDTALREAARGGRGPFVSSCRSTISQNSGSNRDISRALRGACSCAYSAAQRGSSSSAERCFERTLMGVVEGGINGMINSFLNGGNGGNSCFLGICFGGGGGSDGPYAGSASNSVGLRKVQEAADIIEQKVSRDSYAYKNVESALGGSVAPLEANNVAPDDYIEELTEEEVQEIRARREQYAGASLKHGYLATLSADDEETEAAYTEALLNTPKAKMALTGTYLSPAMRATAESLKAEAQQDYQNMLIREQTVELAAGLGMEDAQVIRAGMNDCIVRHLEGGASAGSYARAYYACSGAVGGDAYTSFDGFETAYVNTSGGAGAGGSGPTLYDIEDIVTPNPDAVLLSHRILASYMVGSPHATTLIEPITVNGAALPPSESMPALSMTPLTGRNNTFVAPPLPAQGAFEAMKRYYRSLGTSLANAAVILYENALTGARDPEGMALGLLRDVAEEGVIGEDDLPPLAWADGFAQAQGCSPENQNAMNEYLMILRDGIAERMTPVDGNAPAYVEDFRNNVEVSLAFRPVTQYNNGEGGAELPAGHFSSGLAVLETAIDCSVNDTLALRPEYYIRNAQMFVEDERFDRGAMSTHACTTAHELAQQAMVRVIGYYSQQLTEFSSREGGESEAQRTLEGRVQSLQTELNGISAVSAADACAG